MGGSTKQALLQALSAAEGAYISGQQLAEALGVSRAAVHKAAQALLATGWQAVTPFAPKQWAPTPPPFTSTTRCKAPT